MNIINIGICVAIDIINITNIVHLVGFCIYEIYIYFTAIVWAFWLLIIYMWYEDDNNCMVPCMWPEAERHAN